MHEVRILYTNYRGETMWRRIFSMNLWWGKTDSHPQGQWLLTAFDLDKKDNRDFAVADIKKWEEAQREPTT